MNNNTNKTARDNRRYKYGSLSVVFTLVFLALILVLNLVFSSLSLSGKLTVDLTSEEFSTVGEESIKLLTELGKDLDVTIYFMSPRDMFDIEENTYNGINLTGICRDLAESYAKIFDGSGDKGVVKIEYKELDKDPDFERKYLEEAGTSLNSYSVIVQGKYHYHVVDLFSFYTVENNKYTAFRGEYRLTNAILRASVASQPVVTLTYGHGEPVDADGKVKPQLSGLVSTFEEAGFEVKTADIGREGIDPETKILITYAPNSDLSEKETDAVTAFVGQNKSYMVFVDSSTPALPNLQGCLKDNWGVNYKSENRVTDGVHSLNNESATVIAKKPVLGNTTEENSAAYQLRKTVFDFEGAINTVFPNSVELEASESGVGNIVETVLSTYDTAVSANAKENTESKGEMPLMLLSTGYKITNNVTNFSYIALVSSTEFANAENLSKNYGNRRVLLAAARVLSNENIAPDIASKSFASTALDIESGAAKTLTWLICTILPGIIMIFGVVVYFRRRHL